MAIKKLFLWFSEGVVLLAIVFLVNAQLFISVYYYAVKALDKIKSILL